MSAVLFKHSGLIDSTAHRGEVIASAAPPKGRADLLPLASPRATLAARAAPGLREYFTKTFREFS